MKIPNLDQHSTIQSSSLRMSRGTIQLSTGLALAAFLLMSSQSQAAVRDWNATYDNWSDASSWSPNMMPGVVDLAPIGNLPIAEDADLTLNIAAAVACCRRPSNSLTS